MPSRSIRILCSLFIALVAVQGCSGGSDSSSPSAPDNGGDDGGWSTQLVRSGNFANGEINVAIAGSGSLHVSAYALNVGLYHATNESGSWSSTLVVSDTGNGAGTQNDITVDNAENPHLIYSGSDGIRYAARISGIWSSEDLWMDAGGGSCSIVSDAQGGLHATFDDGSMSDIRYAYRPNGGAWGGSIILADEWINSDCDIDVDEASNPHVAFNFSGHHNLRYAWLDGGWTVLTIEGTDSYPYLPDTGWTPSIAVNRTTGAANIVFWNSTGSIVQYSDGSVNSADTLKATTGWARPCIALDNGGRAHVFFGDAGASTLFYATNSSGSWVVTTMPVTIGGQELAVAIDAGNMIHLIYSNTGGDLRRARLQL